MHPRVPRLLFYKFYLYEHLLVLSIPGYFCPGGTAVPVPCPEGTLSPLEGALAPTACRQCPVGRFCRGEANWEPDGECG